MHAEARGKGCAGGGNFDAYKIVLCYTLAWARHMGFYITTKLRRKLLNIPTFTMQRQTYLHILVYAISKIRVIEMDLANTKTCYRSFNGIFFFSSRMARKSTENKYFTQNLRGWIIHTHTIRY